MDYVVLLNYL